METLAVGSKGVNVELWQAFLNRTGFPVGSVDGIFGVNTQEATEAFQKANKLTPDGIVGNARYPNWRVGLQYSTERAWTLMLTDRRMPTIQKIPLWM
jgi:peptidoglycan hydrolase-like protein with peptidoglycan-binding domain